MLLTALYPSIKIMLQIKTQEDSYYAHQTTSTWCSHIPRLEKKLLHSQMLRKTVKRGKIFAWKNQTKAPTHLEIKQYLLGKFNKRLKCQHVGQPWLARSNWKTTHKYLSRHSSLLWYTQMQTRCSPILSSLKIQNYYQGWVFSTISFGFFATYSHLIT